MQLFNDDCLIESDNIKSGSVDLILTDLPYGTVINAPKNWTVSNENHTLGYSNRY
jgi:DNA modification methylase